MPSSRSCVIASAGVKPSPPATTRSGSRATIFSTSTRGERRDVGQGDGLGREVAAVVGRDDPVADAEREQDLGRRRGERDDRVAARPAISTAVPSSSVTVTGKAAGDGLGLAAVGGWRWRLAAARSRGRSRRWRRRRAGGEPRTARIEAGERRRRGVGAESGVAREPPERGIGRRRGRAGRARPLASNGSKEGSGGAIARSCLPFSRRFEHAPWGRRPDFRPARAVTVAGLCRIHTGFATTRRSTGTSSRSVAQRLRRAG